MRYKLCFVVLALAAVLAAPAAAPAATGPGPDPAKAQKRLDQAVARVHALADRVCTQAKARAAEVSTTRPERAQAAQTKAAAVCTRLDQAADRVEAHLRAAFEEWKQRRAARP